MIENLIFFFFYMIDYFAEKLLLVYCQNSNTFKKKKYNQSVCVSEALARGRMGLWFLIYFWVPCNILQYLELSLACPLNDRGTPSSTVMGCLRRTPDLYFYC